MLANAHVSGSISVIRFLVKYCNTERPPMWIIWTITLSIFHIKLFHIEYLFLEDFALVQFYLGWPFSTP